MTLADKKIQVLEDCITHDKYESVETEWFEVKNQPATNKELYTVKETICAFLNTNGGILLIGIYEDIKNKKYIFNGYNSQFEESFKKLEKESVQDSLGKSIDISELIKFEVKDFLTGYVLLIYVEPLPLDRKFSFFNGVAYERKLTGDHPINKTKLLSHEEYKQEIYNARELFPVPKTTIDNLSVEKLNDYIYWLNKETKIEAVKADIKSAESFLLRKKFIIDNVATTLGMLVCGEHPDDYLGTRCQVDCFVNSQVKIAQNKKIIKDNILQLLESSFGFIYRNIQTGVIAKNGGTEVSEYPEDLIRESINNSLAHRDYTIDRFVNIDIMPQKHIEIRNPGSFKRSLLIEEVNNEIPLRRIIPNQKPVNPRLADILKVFNKYEGKGIGMATLVNECLNDKIDLPYYKFRSENDIALIIPSGKLLDDNIDSLLSMYSGFIEERTEGEQLTTAQKHIVAYLYKSEKKNEDYCYTILLSPDNNHFDAIKSLERFGLIFKHSLGSAIHPVFILNRELVKENFTQELTSLFGNSYIKLSNDYKNCLKLIYKISTYSKSKSISASQAGTILYLNQNQKIIDIKSVDNFKRKIRIIFNKLEKGNFIIKQEKGYLINNFYSKNLFD